MGRKARLHSIESKLFFTLFYLQCYSTFDVWGFVFDLERGRFHRWLYRLQGILETALGKKLVLPERKLESIEQFLERFLGGKEVIFDGTECPVARLNDAQKQKETYSGKKKRHTRKPITGTTLSKPIILLTKARPGKSTTSGNSMKLSESSPFPMKSQSKETSDCRGCKTNL
ncbi:MAG: transposase family protein [Leptolyngbyaceae bacterium]|nr:transposase family protein [Leptolyngbyaceae bacterium]